jgi:Phasin protein
MTDTNERLLQLYRNHLKTTLDLMKVCMDGAERLRGAQLQAIQDAKSDCAGWRERIDSVVAADDLVPLQQQLASAQFENVLGYWSGLFRATAQAQIDTVRQMQAHAATLAAELRRSLEGVPDGGNPAVAAMNEMLSGAFAAYEQAASASEEAVRLAEDAIVTAEAGVRAAAGIHRKAA